ncbi:MAG: hypothetical protein ACT4NY_09005 [Pseudonocardiales bacterium]
MAVSIAAVTDSLKSTGATSHPVSVPTGIQPGEVMIGVCVTSGTSTPTPSWPAGWTILNVPATGTTFVLSIAWKRAGASESGFNITTSTTCTSITRIMRISGAHATTGPAAGTDVTNVGTAPNPPSLNPPDWNIEATLWIPVLAIANTNGGVTTYPAGYTGGGVANTTSVTVAHAWRVNSVASEDPGVFVSSPSTSYRVNTLAIRPAAGVTVTIGQATEIDTATVITRVRRYTTGQVTEADTATVIGPARRVVMISGAEIDVANAITALKGMTSAREVDSAIVVRAAKTVILGRAGSTETATAISHTRSDVAERADETDSATTVSRAKRRHLERAVESDITTVSRPHRLYVLLRAQETDRGVSLVTFIVQVPQATERDTGLVFIGPPVPRPLPPAQFTVHPPVWTLLVAETRTGRVVAELPFSDLSWSCPLNDIGTLKVTVPIESVTTVGLGPWDDRDPRWLLRSIVRSPWRMSLVAVYAGAAVWAGPLITAQPISEGASAEVVMGAAELPAILQRRRIVAPGYEATPHLPQADVVVGPTTLANIALQLISHAVLGSGAELPLLLPTVGTIGTVTHTYAGREVAGVWEQLSKLAELEDGPDLRFDPMLSTDASGQWIKWVVRIGQPHLGAMPSGHVFDHGVGLHGITLDLDASEMTMRSYVPGSARSEPAAIVESVPETGSEADKRVGHAYNGTLVDIGWPLLETTDQDNASEADQALLDSAAASRVTVYGRPVETWSATVDIRAEPRLGYWRVGDDAEFDIRGAALLDDGRYRRRIIAVSGTAADVVSLTLAPVPEVL